MLGWFLLVAVFVILGLAGWIALLYKSVGTVIGVDAFDVFSTLVAFVSLGMNVIQWRESKTILKPIRNPLIALFNELKSRQQRVWARQQRINNETTPIQFYDFTDEMILHFDQLREHVIALIETVAPSLRDEEFFRASTRGLTPDEKELRELWIARRKRQETKQSATTPEPARSMMRRYEGDRRATIVRGFKSGFEWTLEDTVNKVLLDLGSAETLEQAQADADAAAATKPETPWRSTP